MDFTKRHRVEIAARRSEVIDFFKALSGEPADLLLIHRSNPVFYLSGEPAVSEAMDKKEIFKVCFTETMNETAERADLIFPPGNFLETWDEYSGLTGVVSTLQPTMASLYKATGMGDLFLKAATDGNSGGNSRMKTHLHQQLKDSGKIAGPLEWVEAVGRGGVFASEAVIERDITDITVMVPDEKMTGESDALKERSPSERCFAAVPGIRFFDGRGKDRSWLSEIPDPITKVAWQNPVMAHPDTLERDGIRHGELIRLKTGNGETLAPAYAAPTVREGVYLMSLLQGKPKTGPVPDVQHPITLLSPKPLPITGGPRNDAALSSVRGTGRMLQFAHTDGHRTQLKRKIALTTPFGKALSHSQDNSHSLHNGFGMDEFPLTLPLPEGYDPKRDFYPAHDHDDYRWALIVDLDRCIGCGACAAACLCGKQYRSCGRRKNYLRAGKCPGCASSGIMIRTGRKI